MIRSKIQLAVDAYFASNPTVRLFEAARYAENNFPDEKERKEFASEARRRIISNAEWAAAVARIDPEGDD